MPSCYWLWRLWNVICVFRPVSSHACHCQFCLSPLISGAGVSCRTSNMPRTPTFMLTADHADCVDWVLLLSTCTLIFLAWHKQSGISLNLRTGPTGHATVFNQWEGALVFINKEIKTSSRSSKIFKTADGVRQNRSSFRGSQAYFWWLFIRHKQFL